MNNTISVKEAADLWNLSERQVTNLCRNKKINGAKKLGRSWTIPANAQKPKDSRIKSGAYIKENKPKHLPLPIGISEYRIASSEYYYVDKTMLIKEFIDERVKVSLFTRPRRFGKTLNMDMLRTFFEKSSEDTSIYFKDKKIWKCGETYQSYQGKYPVIFVTFKDVKQENWEETYQNIVQILRLEYKRHSELATSDKISDKDYYEKMINNELDKSLVDSAFLMLSKMLHEHYGIAPIIIIDEYDTPIQQGYSRGFYDEVILFMRNLFSGGLKDNHHLSYGFLTGILCVAKESIFSGLNNLKINSVLDNKYSEYFGFTADEIHKMAKYYNAQDKYDEICEWYDGYRFGKTEIFNPWSVINYFNNECEPKAFWQSTGSNEIIGDILSEATEDIYERLNTLVQGKSIVTSIDTNVIYPQIKHDPSSIYSFLLVAGYLKVINSDTSVTSDYMCTVSLPNKEISYVYNKEILQKLNDILPYGTTNSIQEAIYSGNVDEFKKQLRNLLLQSVSFHDTAGENFFHGLVLGLCAMLSNRYYISSNRESGEGRYDIQLMPKNTNTPGILIELKATKSSNNLQALANKALQQINERKYNTEMVSKGINTIFKYGVAFCGKNVEIVME